MFSFLIPNVAGPLTFHGLELAEKTVWGGHSLVFLMFECHRWQLHLAWRCWLASYSDRDIKFILIHT
jgi:hypothetical protein